MDALEKEKESVLGYTRPSTASAVTTTFFGFCTVYTSITVEEHIIAHENPRNVDMDGFRRDWENALTS